MSKVYIADLEEGQHVESFFLCAYKVLLKDKNGKPYINVKLSDRTGLLEARVWEKASHFINLFDRYDYVRARGTLVEFQDHLQFNINHIERVDASQVDTADFLPYTQKDVEAMFEEVLDICQKQVRNPWIKKLLLQILENPYYAKKFKHAPAAKTNHHAWVGGLLEHVHQLMKLALSVLPHYPQVDASLVLAGLLLHDFGKIEELAAERFINYTDKGQMVGHMGIGIQILVKECARIKNFPPKILDHLMHLILAHHGQLEYGSPKEPVTLEALMVHHLDNMDSKLQGFADVLAREIHADPTWSQMSPMFRRSLYKKTEEDLKQSVEAFRQGYGPGESQQKKQEKKPQPNKSNPPPSKPNYFNKAKPKRFKNEEPLKTNLGALLAEKLTEKMTGED